jgi:hypothetical protein
MTRVLRPLAVLALGFTLVACETETPASPTSGSSQAFTANLSPANEVPPIANNEAGASGTATITFNLNKDSLGYITSASIDVTVNVTGFPNGTALTGAHIHPGAAGTNGSVFVSLGLSAGDVSFPTGAGSFTRTGIAVSVDQANAILANPGGFYFNIHTSRNPDGVARGQLTPVQ